MGGAHGRYTSYDYSVAIKEDQGIQRDKYSEWKSEASFLDISPGEYLTVTSNLATDGSHGALASITVIWLVGNAGVGVYTNPFSFDFSDGWSVQFSILFNNSTAGDPTLKASGLNGHCQLHINRLTRPQKSIPVPEGILNHNTYVALIPWARDPQEASLDGQYMELSMLVHSDYLKPRSALQAAWELRSGTY
ncbi:putative beta-galactosidase E [Penicillium rolfsii]|nr:putative beta-galactosidase E [Penicillium rolfsii]